MILRTEKQQVPSTPLVRWFVSAVAILLLLPGAALLGQVADVSNDSSRLLLWYRQPARTWLEALPIGNGRLGAMVFGGIDKEQLQFNEDTLWSGPPPKDWNNAKARQYLPQVRRLLMEEGKYVEANHLTRKMQGPFGESYEPLGYLNLKFMGSGQASDYRRELDLDTAVVRTAFTMGSGHYTREIFSSAPDQVIVIRLACDQPGRISFTAAMNSLLKASTVAIPPDGLALRGRAPRHVEPNYVKYKTETVIYEGPEGPAMRFEAAIKVVAEGGMVSAGPDGLTVRGANSAVLLLAAATGYRGFRIPPDLTVEQIAEKCRKRLDAATAKPYPRVLEDHLADYRRLFRRVSLNLGTGPGPDIPTDERLKQFRAGAADPQLAVLFYQYGRYLLIASSRPGCQPANLQGIWSDAVRPAWSANWTVNINTQMNYWNAEPGNLAECHEPLFDLIAELGANGEKTAQAYYGLDGWVAHHNADLWAQSPPVGESGPNGNPRWSNWPMGGAWLCQHLWEHYAFTQDREFLRQRAYPLMKGAAQFMLGWLVEDGNGHLVTCPSVSPENEFLSPDGKLVAVSTASTMDMGIIWDLFTHCIESSRILGVDDEFRAKLESARSRLFPYQVGSFGQLQEWSQDYREGLRTGHCSHLFPCYPGAQITLRGTPKLAQAVRVSVDRRLDQHVGNGGWPCAWYANLLARLGDGDAACARVEALLRNSAAPNLFNAGHVFQIDGNFGLAAAISEMLLQSHADTIDLLPALPKAWPAGSVKGLRARGGFEVNIEWKDCKVTHYRIASVVSRSVRVRVNGEETTVRSESLAAGVPRTVIIAARPTPR